MSKLKKRIQKLEHNSIRTDNPSRRSSISQLASSAEEEYNIWRSKRLNAHLPAERSDYESEQAIWEEKLNVGWNRHLSTLSPDERAKEEEFVKGYPLAKWAYLRG